MTAESSKIVTTSTPIPILFERFAEAYRRHLEQPELRSEMCAKEFSEEENREFAKILTWLRDTAYTAFDYDLIQGRYFPPLP